MPFLSYTTARWILYSASKALTIAVDKRPLYFRFAALNSINESVANTMNLPTSLVERRKHRALVFCTQEYFGFVCLVESIFLAKLTLKMMLAYNDGDIVARIETSILSHNEMIDRFSCLSG
jgi:hypothetical protein